MGASARVATAVLFGWVVLLGASALSVVAHPPTDGVIRGVETVVGDGDRVTWSGPYGRGAEAWPYGSGPKARFEVWLDGRWGPAATNIWLGGADSVPGSAPSRPFRVAVDHDLSFWEGAYVAMQSWWIRLTFVVTVGVLWWRGSARHAAALALVLGVVRAMQPAWAFGSDPEKYLDSAQAILHGYWPNLLWPPAWPAAMALVGGGQAAGRLLGATLVAATALACGEGRGALLVALSAELIAFGPALYSEPLFVFAGVVVVMGARRPSLRAGLAGAVAMLSRAHSFAVVPLVLRGWSRWLALTVVAAWVVAASVHAGHLVPVSENGAVNLWIAHGSGATGDWHDPGPLPPQGWTAAAVDVMRADPVGAIAQCAHTVSRLWSFSTSDHTLATRPLPLPMLPFGGLVTLAVVGTVRAWWRGFRAIERSALRWLLLTTLVTALFFAPTRYKLALFPGLLPLAAVAVGSRRKG